MSDLQMPMPGEGWRHTNSRLYRIIGVGHDTRDGCAVVIYEDASVAGAVWTRPLGEFLGWTSDHQRRFTFDREVVT